MFFTHETIEGKSDTILHLINPKFINRRDKNGHFSLFSHTNFNRVSVLESILNQGANINGINTNGNTALHRTSLLGFYESTEFLLERGANPNLMNDYGETAIFNAAKIGNLEIVKCLIDYGATPNIINDDGYNLMEVYKSYYKNKYSEESEEYDEMVAYLSSVICPHLLHSNRIFNIDSKLIKYIKNNNIEEVERLYEERVNFHIKHKGYTMVQYSIVCGSIDIANLLVDLEIDIDELDSKGRSLLYLACCRSYFDLVGKIAKVTINKNKRFTNGRTALHRAVGNKSFRTIYELLKNGIDIYVPDNNHKFALHEYFKFSLDHAYIPKTKKRLIALLDLLLYNKYDITKKDKHNTSLYQLIINSRCEELKKFLRHYY